MTQTPHAPPPTHLQKKGGREEGKKNQKKACAMFENDNEASEIAANLVQKGSKPSSSLSDRGTARPRG